MRARRETLIHLLTEAAEIEHNLLCSYLYAAFSLKVGPNSGLTDSEARSVEGWRKGVLSVAVEEMGHLALVNNLLVAVGGAPHFDRPNLPVPPGYHPADFVIRLMPFTKSTLDHFIFLERPTDAEVQEGGGAYRERAGAERIATPGDLTPSTPDYETIGEFYAEIRSTMTAFAEANDGTAFLASSVARQLSPKTIKIPGLIVIRTIEDALAALDTIVEQGEGSSCGKDNCHFSRFQKMRTEWAAIEASNPGFVPFHNAAHDPVMRKPAEDVKRVWITDPKAARLLDLGNALYGVALTFLAHAYALAVPADFRRRLAKGSVELMHALGSIGTALVAMRASAEEEVTAGLTFAMPRNLHDISSKDLASLLRERLSTLRAGADSLGMGEIASAVGKVANRLPAENLTSSAGKC